MDDARVTVYVVDDHPVFRAGLVDLLATSEVLDVVGSAATGADALSELSQLHPDVAVVDMQLADMTGHDVLLALKAAGSTTKVVFLSAHVEAGLVYGVLADGASGYLGKEEAGARVCDAVAAAAAGETVLSPSVQTRLAEQIRSRSTAEAALLTPREQEVLEATAAGESAPEIAARLHLGVATVKTHLHHLYEKLGVSDRAAAVAEAMRRGLLR